MNFARYRPFVLGLRKVCMVGCHLLGIVSCVCVLGGRQRGIVPGAKGLPEEQMAGPARAAAHLNCPLRAVTADGHTTSFGHGEVFFAEKHTNTTFDPENGNISMPPSSDPPLGAWRRQVSAWPWPLGQTTLCRHRIVHGPRARKFETRVEEHA